MTKRFHTIEDAAGQEFYQLPKNLVKNPIYKKLSNTAKISYSILKDRHSVSLKNRWIDEQERVYFLFSDNELAELLDMSVRSTNRYKGELQSFGLIHMERQGLNKRNRIYLLKPEAAQEYKKAVEPYSDTDTPILSSPDTPNLSYQDTPDLSYQDTPILSSLSKNNLSNLNLSNKKEEEEDDFIDFEDFASNEKESAESEEFSIALSFLEKTIGSCNSTIKDDLKKWVNELDLSIIMNEIAFAAKNNAKTYSYIEKMFIEDSKLKIDSLEQLEQKRAAHNKKKSTSQFNSFKKRENVPEWFEAHKAKKAKLNEKQSQETPLDEEMELKRKALLEKLGVVSQ